MNNENAAILRSGERHRTDALVTICAMIAVALTAFPEAVSARGGVPMVQLENNPIVAPAGKTLSLDQIEQAIREAGLSISYPWNVTSSGPGKLELTTVVRGKHTIVVDVIFDATMYSIRYVSSVNMNYSPNKDLAGTIHPNYNTWVQQLKKAIDVSLAKA